MRRRLALTLTLASCAVPATPGPDPKWSLTHYLTAIERLPGDGMPTETKRQEAWDVYKGARWIDRVFYVAGMTAEEVKRSLVDHDGYDPDITVSYNPKRP